MASLLESLAQGLRGAGGVMSGDVHRSQLQEERDLRDMAMRQRAQQIQEAMFRAKVEEMQRGRAEDSRKTELEAAYRADLAAAGNDPEAIRAVAMKYAKPGELLTATRPDKPAQDPEIVRLMAIRDRLPPGHPNRAILDQAIETKSSRAAPINVYSTSLVSGVDENGNPVFVQPSGQPGVPPRPVAGVYPPERADQRRQKAQDQEIAGTVASVESRITKMSQALQENPALVGLPGVARKIGESVAGVVSPSAKTPAIDYENDMALLLADVRKMVEKDPNLSKDERERLYQTLGGGTFQTNASALRTLSNVLEFVKNKKLTGPNRDAKQETADLPKVANDADYNKLPAGARYIAPDGSHRTKR